MERNISQPQDDSANRLEQIQVWYASEISESGRFSLMLRQRYTKDGAVQQKFGVPCAGRVASTESFEQALSRLLAEQLEQSQPEECLLCFDLPTEPNRELCRVYLLLGMAQCSPYLKHAPSDRFDWIDAQTLLDALQTGDQTYAVDAAVVEQIIHHYTGIRNYTIHITDPWSAPGAGSYAGSDEWSYDATYEYFGTLEGAMERGKSYVRDFRDDVSPYLASVVYWLT